MSEQGSRIAREILDAQRQHWEKTFLTTPQMFGDEPSLAARKAVELFKREGKRNILELGGGQGRDSIFFAQCGFELCVLDYSQIGLAAIRQKAEQLGLSHAIRTICHDVRTPLPFESDFFDACYSHMLYCMPITTAELEFLSQDIRRILRPGGLNVYTARNTQDPHYGTGIPREENLYEVGGFIVHFFRRELVEHLAEGYELVGIEEFEEGDLLPDFVGSSVERQRLIYAPKVADDYLAQHRFWAL